MKKLITISTLFLSYYCSYSQNIPNGDFEKWEKRSHYKATGWYTYNSTVFRTNDASIGEYAIKLINKYSETGNGSRGYATNYRSSDKTEFGGFGFDGEPFTLVFDCKHDLAEGDTARIYVDFREDGKYKGKVDFRFTGSTSDEFVTYRVPISWSSSRICDTVRITLYSKVRSKIQGDGYVIYDDIHFENIGYRSPEIFNSSFDNWYDFGLDFPRFWNSIDLRNYDYSRNFYSRRAVEIQHDEKFLGENALAIKNYISGNRARVGYCYIGQNRDDYYTPAFEFKDTFKYLQGYYKYIPEVEDTAQLNFRTYVGNTRRSNNYLKLPKAEKWTFFSMPLTYAERYVPDSASFIAYSALYKDTLGDNTVLYLDNLDLTMEPTEIKLSVPEVDYSSSVYPNPAAKVLYINTDRHYDYARVTNSLGLQTILQIDNGEVNIETLKQGLYFISLESPTYFSKTFKILKQ